ncbi:MAG: hypothetical protein M1834_007906 [Cirrosporium novae-zelandiae]|nr:MAG: hypothetical protein M1834_007906 [Cirrosporium novae-zelandiae]
MPNLGFVNELEFPQNFQGQETFRPYIVIMSCQIYQPPAFQEVFERLSKAVTNDDAQNFQSTTLNDVWEAARAIERQLAERQSLRNMRRIEPLLASLEQYPKVIEVVCNGTPYMPWIWAPIKLMLQLASGYTNIFENLIDAYAKIAQAFPRFDRLSEVFKNDRRFQQVLSLVYVDVLEFHRRAYKFFRRRGWQLLFLSAWADFDIRFKTILEKLNEHKDLVDQEANLINIVEAKISRQKADEDATKQEKLRLATQIQDVRIWLSAENRSHDDSLDALQDRCHPQSCDWILQHSAISYFVGNGNSHRIVWLKGNPGSGKKLNQSLQVVHLIIDKVREKRAMLIFSRPPYTTNR